MIDFSVFRSFMAPFLLFSNKEYKNAFKLFSLLAWPSGGRKPSRARSLIGKLALELQNGAGKIEHGGRLRWSLVHDMFYHVRAIHTPHFVAPEAQE